MPKVSILMPAYNGERYLRKAVESILGQTFTDFEFIIVDDGSTDKTSLILASFADPRILLLRNRANEGIVASLNRGLAVARGEYLARQDADDISLPKRLEKQVEFLDSHRDVGLLGTAYSVINQQGVPIRHIAVRTETRDIQGHLLYENCFCHGAVMCRRSCLEAVGNYRDDLFPAEDYDLWLRISEHFHVANLSDALYQWRQGNASVSATHGASQQERVLHAIEGALARRTATRPQVGLASGQALAQGYLFLATGQWALGALGAGRACLQEAIRLDEQLVEREFLHFVIKRTLFIQAGSGSDPTPSLRFIDTAFRHMPMGVVLKQKSQAVAQAYASAAFKAYEARDKGKVRRCALLALRHDPSWLRNRGIISIVARSCLEGWSCQ